MYVIGGIHKMNKTVTTIAPTRAMPAITDKETNMTLMRNVGAYCRVSTDSDEQLNSYDQQVEEWTKRILDNPSYRLVKIYADAGISGTSIKGRDGFKEMLDDARRGKLDLILVKSISRFARNTVLTISTIRELKELGVEVYFDNEHMSTFDPKNEFMFSIMSSMAQEESRHISENVKWTFQKMMKEGKPFVNCARFLGYKKDEQGNLVIVPEEAEIVKYIFELYDQGYGPAAIEKKLKARHYKTAAGKPYWYASTINGILRNEKYKGDLLLQKSYTVDYLTHKAVKNKGEVQQYYVSNSHEPIVSIELWERVQKRLASQALKTRGKNRDLSKYNARYPLSGMLMCYHCGRSFKRRQWTQGYKTPKIMFQCNGYVTTNMTNKRCVAKPISATIIYEACVDVINKIYLSNGKAFQKILKAIETNLEVANIDKDLHAKYDRRKELENQLDFLLNERMKKNDQEIQRRLDAKYSETMDQYNSVQMDIAYLSQRKERTSDSSERYQKIKDILKGKTLTAEMLTKEVIDAFILSIIVLDRNNVVFVLNGSGTMDVDDIKEKRKQIVKRQSVYENTIFLRDPFKLMTLHYTVVLV